jgi:hypothetical protein
MASDMKRLRSASDRSSRSSKRLPIAARVSRKLMGSSLGVTVPISDNPKLTLTCALPNDHEGHSTVRQLRGRWGSQEDTP